MILSSKPPPITRRSKLELAGFGVLASMGLVWAMEQNTAAFIVAFCAIGIAFVASCQLQRSQSMLVTGALVVHVVLGMGYNAYDKWALFDDILHFAFVGALAHFFLSSLRRWSESENLGLSHAQLLASCVMFACGCGALWEVFEFAIDLTGYYSAQRGLFDTMTDLIAGGFGGLVAYCGWRLSTLIPFSSLSDKPSSGW